MPKSNRTKIASIVAVVSARVSSRISDISQEEAVAVADADTLHTIGDHVYTRGRRDTHRKERQEEEDEEADKPKT